MLHGIIEESTKPASVPTQHKETSLQRCTKYLAKIKKIKKTIKKIKIRKIGQNHKA